MTKNIYIHANQALVKKWFDTQSMGDKKFQVGDLVLKWDKSHETKENTVNFKVYG